MHHTNCQQGQQEGSSDVGTSEMPKFSSTLWVALGRDKMPMSLDLEVCQSAASAA